MWLAHRKHFNNGQPTVIQPCSEGILIRKKKTMCIIFAKGIIVVITNCSYQHEWKTFQSSFKE